LCKSEKIWGWWEVVGGVGKLIGTDVKQPSSQRSCGQKQEEKGTEKRAERERGETNQNKRRESLNSEKARTRAGKKAPS